MSMQDANKVIRFIERHCRIPQKGHPHGVPMRLAGFQKKFVRGLYKQGVTRALLSVAKKNGKSELLAAINLAHLVGPMAGYDERLLLISPGSLKQSAVIFERACYMVRNSPELADLIEITASSYKMHHRTRLNVLEAMSTSKRSIHGQLPTMWTFDELAQAPDTVLYEAMDRAQGTLEGAKGIVISTRSEVAGNTFGEIVDGIREGRFWILPLNPDAEAQVRARMDSILDRTDPPIPSIG